MFLDSAIKFSSIAGSSTNDIAKTPSSCSSLMYSSIVCMSFPHNYITKFVVFVVYSCIFVPYSLILRLNTFVNGVINAND